MGLNPTLILGGIIAMATIAVLGAIESPTKTTEIFGFCGMITGTLLLMLKQDQDHRKLQEQLRSNNRVAISSIAEVKASVQQTAQKMDTVMDQTNGALVKRVEEKVDATIKAAMPEAVKSIAPFMSPGTSPGENR